MELVYLDVSKWNNPECNKMYCFHKGSKLCITQSLKILKTGLALSTARRVNAMASSKETKTLFGNLLISPSGNRRLMYFMSPYHHRGGVLFPLKWALLIISPWNGLFSSPCLYCAWFLWSGEAELRCGPSVVSSIGAAGNGMMHTSREEAISLEAVSCLLPELKPATRHMP